MTRDTEASIKTLKWAMTMKGYDLKAVSVTRALRESALYLEPHVCKAK